MTTGNAHHPKLTGTMSQMRGINGTPRRQTKHEQEEELKFLREFYKKTM